LIQLCHALEWQAAAQQNEIIRLNGLLRVADTERRDALKELADFKEEAYHRQIERDLAED